VPAPISPTPTTPNAPADSQIKETETSKLKPLSNRPLNLATNARDTTNRLLPTAFLYAHALAEIHQKGRASSDPGEFRNTPESQLTPVFRRHWKEV
jgi:hypothetical protein